MALNSYRAAMIPERFDEDSWDTFFDKYKISSNSIPAEAVQLKNGIVSGCCYLVSSRHFQASSLLVSLLLRAACTGGLGCRLTNISELMDIHFKLEGLEIDSSVYRLPLLVVECGSECEHKYNVHMMKKIVDRWGNKLTTVLVTQKTPTGLSMRYNDNQLQEIISDRFMPVWIEPV